MNADRIDEAKVIDRAERIEKARQRIAHAEHMLNVCSEFSVGLWSEVLEDSKEFLAELESQGCR